MTKQINTLKKENEKLRQENSLLNSKLQDNMYIRPENLEGAITKAINHRLTPITQELENIKQLLLSSHRNKQNIVEIETTLATQHSDEALLPPASSATSDISSNEKPTKQPTLPTEPKSRSTTPPQHAGAGTFRVGNTGTKARIQTKETGMPTTKIQDKIHSAQSTSNEQAAILSREDEKETCYNKYGWKLSKHKKKNQRPAPVKGKNKNFNLKVAQRKSHLFVSGFDTEIQPVDIEQYIKGTSDINIKCEKMSTKRDKYVSSFKLEVQTDLKEKIMSPGLWGEGITVNHFLPIRQPPRFTQRR